MKIEFDDIGYEDNILIREGELEFKSNDIVLFKGLNGTGKTLLFCELQKNYLQDAIYVEQSNKLLLYNKTILENIAMTDDRRIQEQVKNKLIEYGLIGLLKKNIRRISGGEKRMICILRGFFSESQILLLDEPTNDLDYRNVDIIKRMSGEEHKTILIITHDKRLDELADVIYEVKETRLSRVNEMEKKQEREPISKDISQRTVKSRPEGKFIRSCFRFCYIGRIMLIAVLILFIFGMRELCDLSGKLYISSNAKIEEIFSNQIDLYVPQSSMGGKLMYEGYYYPLDTLILDGGIIDYLDRIGNGYDYGDSYNSFMINDNHIFDVYPLEVVDFKAPNIHNVLDCYATDATGDVQAYVDTTDFADVPSQYREGTYGIPFNYSEYEKILNDIILKSDGQYAYSFVTIKLKDGFTFEDFINDEQIIALKEEGIIIRSNETIEIINNMRVLLESVEIILKCIVISVILMAVSYISIYFYLKLARLRMKIFMDYSLKLDVIIKELNSMVATRTYNIVALCISFASMILCTKEGSSGFLSYVILQFIFIMLIGINNIIIRKLTSRFSKKIVEKRR